MTPEQAQSLLNSGKISQDTYDRVVNSSPSFDNPPPAGTFDALPNDDYLPVVESTPSLELSTLPIRSQTPEEAIAPELPPVEMAAPEAQETPVMPSTVPVVESEVQTINSTEKKATEAAKKAQEDIQKGIEAERKAQEELYEVDAKKAREAFNLNQEAQQIEAKAAEEVQKIQAEGNVEIENRLLELEQKTENLANREYEGYWAKKSTGQKILGAISLALGAYASALTGGPNTALNIISKAADDDFRNFQNTTANKIKAINQSRLSAETKRRLISDQVMSLEAKKLSDIKIIQNKIGNLSNKFADPESKAKLAQLSAQLDQKAAAARQQFEMALTETVQTNVQRKIANIKIDPTTGQPQVPVDQAKEIPGYGQARTEKEAIKLRERKTSTEEAAAAADRIEALWAGKTKFDPRNLEDLAALRTELGLIQGSMRLALVGPGAVTDAEREFMNSLIGDPSKVLSFEDVEKAKLRTIINKMKTGLEAEAKNVVVGYEGKPESEFPRTVRKDGKVATVSNEAELQEAQSEGWK